MNSSNRVLYFSRNLTTHDHRFLSSLAETDYEIFFLRLENRKHDVNEISLPEKINILPPLNLNKSFKYLNLLENLDKLKTQINQIQPHIIHAGPIQTCGFLVALSEFNNLITMSWGSDILVDSQKNFLYKWITKHTLKKTSVLIADCDAVSNIAIRFGFTKERIIKFPWGIDLQKFQPGVNNELRNQLGWEDKFIILSLRSWEKLYGVDVVVKAFVEAAKSEPDLRLLLLGTGSMKSVIEKFVADNNMHDRIFMGGVINQKDLPDYYQASDLYISASYSDGSSVSLMEALASGLPVLVSDIPGNKEWIDQGRYGWLFKTGSVENLTKSMSDIYKNKAHISQVGIEARKSAEKKANWEVNFQKLLFAYQLALNPEI
jgi:glycosyltransferase involved in cell wall biosynthesis